MGMKATAGTSLALILDLFHFVPVESDVFAVDCTSDFIFQVFTSTVFLKKGFMNDYLKAPLIVSAGLCAGHFCFLLEEFPRFPIINML